MGPSHIHCVELVGRETLCGGDGNSKVANEGTNEVQQKGRLRYRENITPTREFVFLAHTIISLQLARLSP